MGSMHNVRSRRFPTIDYTPQLSQPKNSVSSKSTSSLPTRLSADEAIASTTLRRSGATSHHPSPPRRRRRGRNVSRKGIRPQIFIFLAFGLMVLSVLLASLNTVTFIQSVVLSRNTGSIINGGDNSNLPLVYLRRESTESMAATASALQIKHQHAPRNRQSQSVDYEEEEKEMHDLNPRTENTVKHAKSGANLKERALKEADDAEEERMGNSSAEEETLSFIETTQMNDDPSSYSEQGEASADVTESNDQVKTGDQEMPHLPGDTDSYDEVDSNDILETDDQGTPGLPATHSPNIVSESNDTEETDDQESDLPDADSSNDLAESNDTEETDDQGTPHHIDSLSGVVEDHYTEETDDETDNQGIPDLYKAPEKEDESGVVDEELSNSSDPSETDDDAPENADLITTQKEGQAFQMQEGSEETESGSADDFQKSGDDNGDMVQKLSWDNDTNEGDDHTEELDTDDSEEKNDHQPPSSFQTLNRNGSGNATSSDAGLSLQQRRAKHKHRVSFLYLAMSKEEVVRMYHHGSDLLSNRRKRFPSASERVKIYMTNWYAPPCANNTKGFAQFQHTDKDHVLIREVPTVTRPEPRVFEMSNSISSKSLFQMNESIMKACSHEYCEDADGFIVPAVHRVDQVMGATSNVPILLRFGDHERSTGFVPKTQRTELHPNLPIIRKFRRAIDRDERERLTSRECYESELEFQGNAEFVQPIVWFMKTFRHYGSLRTVKHIDTPWEEKKNKAIFRGGATGIFRHGLTLHHVEQGMSPTVICRSVPRCNLVYETAKSELVDAKLTHSVKREFASAASINPNVVPTEINGISLFAEKTMDHPEMLKYKAIIMLEGNDVSSGLKWAMISKSVVMMQKPTMSSWAMEEMMIPWYHYIPLNDKLSDVEEKMQWILDNDAKAEKIAHQGSLWMKDLVFHPDAAEDNRQIFDEMIRRYRAHFREDPTIVSST